MKRITPKKTITKLHGYLLLDKKYADLLRTCRAKETTRYAINLVCSYKGQLATTDGRRMMVINIDIPTGLYFLTKDNLLLPSDEVAKFPKWEGIIIKEPKRIEIKTSFENTGQSLGKVLHKINTAGPCVDLFMYEEVLKKMAVLFPTNLVLEVAKEDARHRPVQLRCETGDYKILFILMPINLG